MTSLFHVFIFWIYCSLGFQRIYIWNACLFLHWKWGTVKVCRSNLCYSTCFDHLPTVARDNSNSFRCFENPNISNQMYDIWASHMICVKVLQRSSSSSRLLLRAASSRTWIYKQLRQIIILFVFDYQLCREGANNEQRASWSSNVCAETFDRTNCFVHSLSNYQRVNCTNYKDCKHKIKGKFVDWYDLKGICILLLPIWDWIISSSGVWLKSGEENFGADWNWVLSGPTVDYISVQLCL